MQDKNLISKELDSHGETLKEQAKSISEIEKKIDLTLQSVKHLSEQVDIRIKSLESSKGNYNELIKSITKLDTSIKLHVQHSEGVVEQVNNRMVIIEERQNDVGKRIGRVESDLLEIKTSGSRKWEALILKIGGAIILIIVGYIAIRLGVA